jgi:RHS repeat-associated protein
VVNNLRFPGQYFDVETGLSYNWQRYYDSANGRYISEDPIGLVGGQNVYVYVDVNPVGNLDPSGLDGQRAGSWAMSKVGNTDYQWWDPHPQSKGRRTSLFGGIGSLKCNAFVWDALLNGRNPPGKIPISNSEVRCNGISCDALESSRIPTAKDWESGQVEGYRRLNPGEQPIIGDVVAYKGHVGIFYPLKNGKPGTISATSRMLEMDNPYPRVVHNDWGFRSGQTPTIMRCKCDDTIKSHGPVNNFV